MSACISSHGEFDSHETTAGNYICDLCGELVEDKVFIELARVAAIEDGWRKTNAECIKHWNRADRAEAERDAALARLARVEELFNGGPETPCRTTRHTIAAGTEWESELECVEVPLDDLRAALADPEGGA